MCLLAEILCVQAKKIRKISLSWISKNMEPLPKPRILILGKNRLKYPFFDVIYYKYVSLATYLD